MTIAPTAPGAELDTIDARFDAEAASDSSAGERMLLSDVVAVATGAPSGPGVFPPAPEAVLRHGVRAVESLLTDLEAYGVTVPRETRRAFALEREIVDALTVADPVAWLAEQDSLDDVTGAAAVEMLTAATVRAHVQTQARHGGTRPLFDALRQRGIDALAAALPDVVDQLRARWHPAAAVIAAAASTGLRSSTTADQAIELGDDAVIAWRALDDPEGFDVLDQLWALRNRALFYTGHHVSDDDRARRGRVWLDLSADGPVELTADLVPARPDDHPRRRDRTQPADLPTLLDQELATVQPAVDAPRPGPVEYSITGSY